MKAAGRLRVGMLTSAPLPPREGIGYYVWNLARYLVKQGHEVQLITRGSARATYKEVVEGVTIWRPAYLPLFPFHVHFHSVFVNALVSHLDGQIDLYHAHTPLVRSLRTRRPVFVTVHTPIKADSRASTTSNLHSFLSRMQRPVSIMLERELFQRADYLASVACSVRDELTEYGINPGRVVVLGNGADTDTFHPREDQSKHIPPYFITVGRLGLRKGLDDLIHCANILNLDYPEIQFWIAGDGPLRSELLQMITRLGLGGRVKLLGHIADRSHLASLYQEALGLIHPAHYEGLPTVLLEAMACGSPVVATAVSGNLDVIQDGVNGLLVPPHAPQRMASAVIHLIQDPELRQRLGKAAYHTIAERYSWDVVGSNYASWYQEMLARAQR